MSHTLLRSPTTYMATVAVELSTAISCSPYFWVASKTTPTRLGKTGRKRTFEMKRWRSKAKQQTSWTHPSWRRRPSGCSGGFGSCPPCTAAGRGGRPAPRTRWTWPAWSSASGRPSPCSPPSCSAAPPGCWRGRWGWAGTWPPQGGSASVWICWPWSSWNDRPWAPVLSRHRSGFPRSCLNNCSIFFTFTYFYYIVFVFHCPATETMWFAWSLFHRPPTLERLFNRLTSFCDAQVVLSLRNRLISMEAESSEQPGDQPKVFPVSRPSLINEAATGWYLYKWDSLLMIQLKP